jgi:hypothetical protein
MLSLYTTESSQREPSLVPELEDAELMASGRVNVMPMNTRDLPYG